MAQATWKNLINKKQGPRDMKKFYGFEIRSEEFWKKFNNKKQDLRNNNKKQLRHKELKKLPRF
jgi:hypothetical protein